MGPAWEGDALELVRDIVPVMTIWREASDQGKAGMDGVAWVILNRMRERKQTASQVCLAPLQFSSMDGPHQSASLRWPTAYDWSFRLAFDVWHACMSNRTPDPTEGSDLYYATIIPAPEWTARAEFKVQIGQQRFYRERTP